MSVYSCYQLPLSSSEFPLKKVTIVQPIMITMMVSGPNDAGAWLWCGGIVIYILPRYHDLLFFTTPML